MDSQLKAICQEILDNESDNGCCGDMTVTSLKAIKKLRKYMKNEDKIDLETKRIRELHDLREVAAQECFEKSDLDGLECVDQEGWETDANQWLKKFYYKSEELDADSKTATFVVNFKKNSDIIKESYLNIW